MNGIGWIERIAGDLRDALRQVRRSPGFAAIVAAHARRSASAAPPPCSASSRRCCWRRCRTRSRGAWSACTSSARTAPTRASVVAGTHFAFVREHAGRRSRTLAALAHYSETGVDLVDRRRRRAAAGPARCRAATSRRCGAAGARPRLRPRRRDGRPGAWCSATASGARTSPAIRRSSARTVRLSAETYEVAGVTRARLRRSLRAGRRASWVPYALAARYLRREQLAHRDRPAAPRHQPRAGAGRARDAGRADAGAMAAPPRRTRSSAVPLHEELVSRRARPAAPRVRGRRRWSCSSPA